MRPLIHKASVDITANRIPSSVFPNDNASLRIEDDGTISVILILLSRLPFGLGKSREFVAGILGQKATALIRPAILKNARLRVRIVEIEPAHLSQNGKIRLFISVWGDPMVLLSEQPQKQIFSRSRINDDPA
jgi:hypothetical protein